MRHFLRYNVKHSARRLTASSSRRWLSIAGVFAIAFAAIASDASADEWIERTDLVTLYKYVPPEGGWRTFRALFREGFPFPPNSHLRSIRNISPFYSLGFLAAGRSPDDINCSDSRTFTVVAPGATVTPADLGYSDSLPIYFVACSTAPLEDQAYLINVTWVFPDPNPPPPATCDLDDPTWPVVVGENADGRLEAFVRGRQGDLCHRWQTSPGNWGANWYSLGGSVDMWPTVVRTNDGRLAVFSHDRNHQVVHIGQVTPGGGWSQWYHHSGPTHWSPPAVKSNADGRLEIFESEYNGSVWHRWQLQTGADFETGAWSDWVSLGGQATSEVDVARNVDGTLEVFVRGPGPDYAIWHARQLAPGSSWSDWLALSGLHLGSPKVAINADGTLRVFVRGDDYALWLCTQQPPAVYGSWSSCENDTLGGYLTSERVVVATNADGRLEVFVSGASSNAYHIWQLDPGGRWQTSFENLGGVGPLGGVGINANGRLEIFQMNGNGIYHNWQQVAGGWYGWARF